MGLLQEIQRKASAEYDELSVVKDRVRDIPVCLITPPSPFLADERVFPFLASAKIAAELRKNGNRTELLDLSGYSNFLDIVEEYIKEADTNVFGITATSPQIPAAVAVRDKIKEIRPEAVVVLGGPHATLTHGAMIQDTNLGREGRGTKDFKQLTEKFDVIVAGDGEKAVFYAIDLDNKNQIIEAANLKSPLFMRKGELESFEPPARDLIDIDSYYYYIDGHRAFSLIAQLGCPYECGFCGGRDVLAYRMARIRSIESVKAEVKSVVCNSIFRALATGDPSKVLTAVMFYDDELNISPSNLENLCTAMIEIQRELLGEIDEEALDKLGLQVEKVNGEERLAMRFRGFVKAELFTQEQANLMYEAGFRILLTGVESGSDKILSAMKKHTSREINSRCIEYAHNAGLKIKALMSIGHPGESLDTIEESIEWVLSNLKPGDDVDWTIITQYPGSPYYDRSEYVPVEDAWLYQLQNKKTGEILRLWSKEADYVTDVYYYKGVPGNYTAYVWTDYLSKQELVEARDYTEKITRNFLGLTQIQSVAARQFEHSMGQGLPSDILRKST